MKRIEKALLHNPDLCPFGLVAQAEKSEEPLLISFFLLVYVSSAIITYLLAIETKKETRDA
ncbi:hypothetical protein HQ584_03520 [Patescibacteria group bacterium]|nr:hypothetical protein [Patescibacteria group bacterium]